MKLSLSHSVSYLLEHKLSIGINVTDYHRLIGKWIKNELPGTIICLYDVCHMYAVLTAKALVADVRKLSTQHQTSSVEVYHSVVIHFAPKLLVFSYEGMVCRYMLYTILCLNHSLWCINIILLSIHQANLSSFAFQREQQPLTSKEES